MTVSRVVLNGPVRYYDVLKVLRGRRIVRMTVQNEAVQEDAGNGFTKWKYTGRATIELEVGP